MEQFMMSPLKWGTITKLGVCPGTSLKPSQNTWCHWVNRCPQEICEGKGQHTMCGQFSLATGLCSLYTTLQQQESQTYSYIENCWRLWLCGYNQSFWRALSWRALVSFLFASRCSMCPAICKNGSTRCRAIWSRRHCKWHTNGESCRFHWRLLC